MSAENVKGSESCVLVSNCVQPVGLNAQRRQRPGTRESLPPPSGQATQPPGQTLKRFSSVLYRLHLEKCHGEKIISALHA